MKRIVLFISSLTLFMILTAEDCGQKATSASGASKAQTMVQTDLNGIPLNKRKSSIG